MTGATIRDLSDPTSGHVIPEPVTSPSGPRRMAIGDSALVPWLERQLAARDWKQADLARGLGVSTGMVSNWLTGQRRVSPYYCEQIAALLGADVDYLLALAGHRPMVLSSDPDEPVEQLATKLRRVRLSAERFAVLDDALDGMLARDRREARGKQLTFPGAFGGAVGGDGE